MQKHARGGSCQSTFALASADTSEVQYYSAWDVAELVDIIGFRPVRRTVNYLRQYMDSLSHFLGGGFRNTIVECRTDHQYKSYFDTKRTQMIGRGFRPIQRGPCLPSNR